MKHFMMGVLGSALLAAPVVAEEDNHIRIGGYPDALFDASRLDAEITLALILNESLGAASDSLDTTTESVAVTVFESFDEAAGHFEAGKLDALFCLSTDYFSVINHVAPDSIFALVIGGSYKQGYSLVVNNSGRGEPLPITLSDLRGDRLTIPNSHQVGQMFLANQLSMLEAGDVEQFFGDVVYSESSQSAIIDLFFEKTDAVLISNEALETAAALNPQTRSRLKTVLESPPYVVSVIVFHRRFELDRAELLRATIETVHKRARGAQLLSLFRAQQLQAISATELESVRQLFSN